MDEQTLSKKISEYLNNLPFSQSHFEFIDDFCDIADEKNGAYIEVKIDHFAPAQLLIGIARKEKKNAKMLGVADSKEIRLYSPPPFKQILAFAAKFDSHFRPSEFDKPDFNKRAEQLLGTPSKTIPLDFSSPPKYQFITKAKDDLNALKKMTTKYQIAPELLVIWLDGVGERASIKVTKDGWLRNIDAPIGTPSIFMNETEHEKRKMKDSALSESGRFRRPNHTPIKERDAAWFESLRVRHEDFADVLHEVDRLMPRKKRRELGVFWTEAEIGDRLADEILRLTKPDYVVEPCVGGGSLIKNIAPHVKGTLNDKSESHVEGCRKVFDEFGWKATSLDVVNTETKKLIEEWQVPDGELLLYTNPPFGTAVANKLVSKKNELGDAKSRKLQIAYPEALVKYGKGDLFLPIIGRLIEIAVTRKNCCLAFFSPLGLFCGRKRYMNLFTALLKDFQFLKGYVFVGNYFHDINKTLPIALSIWKYAPSINSKHLDLDFIFLEKEGKSKTVYFKYMPLLKDGWRYDRRDKDGVTGEIAVQQCGIFANPTPKIIHLNLRQGGSEVIATNVKIPLKLPNMPDELVYALWSLSVGLGAFGTSLSDPMFPVYMRDAYVHMPDFDRKETLEILAYSALHSLIKNYAPNKIGFFNRALRFGNEHLTKGVQYLFDICKDCPVYDEHNISDCIKLIREGEVDKTKFRKGIREQVSNRLTAIGYWEYVPIPMPQAEKVVKSKTGALLIQQPLSSMRKTS